MKIVRGVREPAPYIRVSEVFMTEDVKQRVSYYVCFLNDLLH